MKIAVLHQDLEWAEETMKRYLVQNGHDAVLVDFRDANIADLTCFDVVFNRVYASVANRNWQDNLSILDLLGHLEAAGVKCVNSQKTTQADYDKWMSAKIMQEMGVPTLATALINNMQGYTDQSRMISKWGFPLVIKRNMGGRAVDIYKANNDLELQSWLDKVFSADYLEHYAGGMIIQPYLPSVKPYDIRIAMVDGHFAYSYTRSLIPMRPGEEAWVGSGEWGSVLTEYTPSAEEIDISRRASSSIGAIVNEVDLLETDNGFVVIENNPTPGFTENKELYLNRLCDLFVQSCH